jgi:ADP-heptose:LPS heptosyltransferase
VTGSPRIAVLRANALGDFVFSIPALLALRASQPTAHLTLLGKAWHAEFLPGRGLVDEVVVVPAVPGLTVPVDAPPDPGFPAWLDEHRGRYDIAVQVHGGGRTSTPLLRRLEPSLLVGLQAHDAPPCDRTLRYVYYQHEVVRQLEVVGLLGATWPPTPTLTALASDVEAADAALADAGVPVGVPLAVLHPGATDARRRWGPDRFGAVGRHLHRRGCAVVVTGVPAEAAVTRAVVAAASGTAVDLTGAVSLAALVGVLRRAAIVVSNDTGPLHLADALGRPTVGIYWCGNLINGGPLLRALHRPMVSWTICCPQCGADCTRDHDPTRRGGGPVCAHRASLVDAVTVADVLAAVDDLLVIADSGVVAGAEPRPLVAP